MIGTTLLNSRKH